MLNKNKKTKLIANGQIDVVSRSSDVGTIGGIGQKQGKLCG